VGCSETLPVMSSVHSLPSKTLDGLVPPCSLLGGTNTFLSDFEAQATPRGGVGLVAHKGGAPR